MKSDTLHKSARLLERVSNLRESDENLIITYVRHLDLVTLLQMISECFDELLGWYVFHSVYVSVDQTKMLLQD